MYTLPPKMEPWLSIDEACKSLNVDDNGFYCLLNQHSQDIPHRYADMPDGKHDPDKELKISPLAMINLYLIKGFFGKAHELIVQMENAGLGNPVSLQKPFCTAKTIQ